MTIETTARAFFDACETGKGWAGCSAYCHDGATFSAQSGALADITALDAYTEWMKGLFGPMPGATYELKAFSVDEERGVATAFGVFHGTHTVDGPVPATGKTTASDYVYAMEFEGDKIRHMTKIWNDGHALAELGWA
ncbi:MAG: nuclear transport factor 2 family protein [Pseudomonadota bacterium]